MMLCYLLGVVLLETILCWQLQQGVQYRLKTLVIFSSLLLMPMFTYTYGVFRRIFRIIAACIIGIIDMKELILATA